MVTGNAPGRGGSRTPSVTGMPDDRSGDRAPLSLRDYLGVLWRRSWIILVVTAIVFAVGLWRSERQTKMYQASGQLVFANAAGGSGGNASPDIATQIGVITSPAIHAAAAQTAPGIGNVSAQQVGLGNIISVTATDASPAQAARTANATIDAYVAFVTRQATAQTAATEAAIQAKLRPLQTQINVINLHPPVPGSPLATTRDMLVSQASALQQQLDSLQITAAGSGSGITVVARATPPTTPSSPKPRTDGLLALGAGLLLGLVIAFLVEYLVRSGKSDRTSAAGAGTRPEPEAWAIEPPAPRPELELPRTPSSDVTLMGVVPAPTSSNGDVVSMTAPNSGEAQSYRSLRSAAAFIGLERGRCVQVTSVPGRDGKTETLANLAVLLATSGRRVVVVDCDLRNPRVHQCFGLSNDTGFTSVMSGTTLAQAVMCVPDFEQLYVLTAGPPADHPEEMLASQQCRETLASLLMGGTIVLVDTPPVLADADALTFARTAPVDGFVLVATPKSDAREVLREALDALHRSADRPIGVVLTTPDETSRPEPVRGVRRSRVRGKRRAAEGEDESDAVDALMHALGYDGNGSAVSGIHAGVGSGRPDAYGSDEARWP